MRENADTSDDDVMSDLVLHSLELLAEFYPGRAIEVRIPPVAAIQCGEGPRHTRGTPPNVVECDPATWQAILTGNVSWREALRSGALSASGDRSNISSMLEEIAPHLPARLPETASKALPST